MMDCIDRKTVKLATTITRHAVQAGYRVLACMLAILAYGACVEQPYVTCPQTRLVCQGDYECSRDGDFCTQLHGCGNGRIDFEEVCDDGNRISGDGCSGDCRSDEACGNGIRDTLEQCDDGNHIAEDGCSPVCLLEDCGNGAIDRYEICDDGSNINGDGCSADCLSTETCGNGYVDAFQGEECDDGNTSSGDGCSVACKDENCGNGIVDVEELCDDDNNDNGDGCSADCRSREICGNRIRDAAEECDDGNLRNGDDCNAVCAREVCGNAILDVGEACDDGNRESGDGCSAECHSTEICGDGLVDYRLGETCDDGNRVSNDGCSAKCLLENCGDGKLGPGEACDDGNEVDGDGCSSDCRSDEDCGNEVIDRARGEVCDDGNSVSGDGCSADCRSEEKCGNRILDAAAGERCDDGNTRDRDGCRADCRSNETCGNSELDLAVGEVCDDGNLVSGDECSANCRSDERCGNGIIDAIAGEICDDGNEVDGDGCSADCHSDETCGNGIVDPAVGETCDDSNQESGDDCEADCTLPTAGVIALAAGGEHTCALLETGAVRCWGKNSSGQLGYGHTNNIGDDEVPSEAGDVAVGGTMVKLAAGQEHTCALLEGGAVRCWGENGSGQLGYGHTHDIGDDEVPAAVGNVDVGGTVVEIAAGGEHTCALLEGGAVRCWGQNSSGQLGYGHTNTIGDDEVPSAAGDVEVGGPVIALAAGGEHTCALLEGGAVRCWGRNSNGQLGYGHTNQIGDNEVPSVAGPVAVGANATALAAGEAHTCALLEGGAVRCWGANYFGQLGYGHVNRIGDNEAPSTAGDVSVGGTVVRLAAGDQYTCALMATAKVRCWGQNSGGQLGYGNTRRIGDNELPIVAGDVQVGDDVAALAAGGSHVCALLTRDAVRCWGYNGFGQLGYGHLNQIGDDEVPAEAGDVDVGRSLGGAQGDVFTDGRATGFYDRVTWKSVFRDL